MNKVYENKYKESSKNPIIKDDLITNVLIITIVDHYFYFIKNFDKKENLELLKEFKNEENSEVSLKKYLLDLALNDFKNLITDTSDVNFFNKIKQILDRYLKNNDNRTLL